MGQHCAVNSATQRTLPAGRATGAARYIGRVGALAVALGVGAAVASGAGIATGADDPAGNDPGGNSGGVQSPAADGPAGDLTDSATARVTLPAGASHSVKLGKRGFPRLPRMLQNNSGGAHSSTDDTTAGAAAAGQPRTPAAAGDRGRAAAAKDPGLPERLEASIQVLLPAGIVGPAAPSGGTARSSPRDQAVADSGTGARVRRQNTDRVATRVRVLVQDTATALHQPSGAVVDKPLADSAAALVHTDDSTLNRLTAESVGPTAAFTPHLTVAPPARPIVTVVSSLLAAVGITSPSGVSTGDASVAPMPLVLGVLQLIRREIDHTFLHEGSLVASSTVAPRSLVTSAAAVTTTQPKDRRPLDLAWGPTTRRCGQHCLRRRRQMDAEVQWAHCELGRTDVSGQEIVGAGQRHHHRSDVDHSRGVHPETQRGHDRVRFPARTAQHRLSRSHRRQQVRSTAQRLPYGVRRQRVPPTTVGCSDPPPRRTGKGTSGLARSAPKEPAHGYRPSTWLAMNSQVGSSSAALRRGSTTSPGQRAPANHRRSHGYAVVLQLSAVMPNTPPSATVTQSKPST